MNRLPLTALRAFEAVAAQLSFGGAAVALSVTPAAISQQIRGLETELGVKLFERRGTRILLTPEGARLLPGVQRGFTELRHAVNELRQANERTKLNITMVPSFLQRWLLPQLPAFQALHPEIDLRLSAAVSLEDLVGGDFHAGIRYGGGRWQGLSAAKLFEDWMLPVCDPATLARDGRIASFEDFCCRRLLHSTSEPWSRWVEPVFGTRVPLGSGPTLDDSAAVAIAAERGQGLALVRWSLAAHDVAAGRLVCAADQAVQTRRSYYLVMSPDRARLPQVRLFRAWVIAAGLAFDKPPLQLLPATGS